MGKVLKIFVLGIWVPIGIIILWWFLTEHSTSLDSPSLSSIFSVFRQDWLPGRGNLLNEDLLPSLENLFLGLAIAIGLGISFGLLLASFDACWAAIRPTAELARAVPVIIFFPLVLLLFGLSHWGKVAIIAYGAFWPVLLNTISGVQNLDPTVLDVAKSYRLSRRQRLLRIILPGSSPQIMAGIRVAVAIGVTLVVASEYYAAYRGIGYYVFAAQEQFNSREVWAGTILLGLLGYALTLAVRLIELLVLRWHFRMRRQSSRL